MFDALATLFLVLVVQAYGIMSTDDYLRLPRVEASGRFFYGNDSQQFADLYLPSGPGPHPVVALVHGGCWLSEFDLAPLGQLAKPLADTGIAVWNIEYRRLYGGGGWPETFLDVGRALDHLRTVAKEYPLNVSSIVVAGHSAGGHLALWAGLRHKLGPEQELYMPSPIPVHGVASLAGIPDLEAAYSTGVCGRLAITLMGGDIRSIPARYAQGVQDGLVPYHYVSSYVVYARSKGDQIFFKGYNDTGHFETITATKKAGMERTNENQNLKNAHLMYTTDCCFYGITRRFDETHLLMSLQLFIQTPNAPHEPAMATLRVYHYNILADHYCKMSEFYGAGRPGSNQPQPSTPCPDSLASRNSVSRYLPLSCFQVDFEWKQRLSKIVNSAVNCNPDVICLQEVDHWEDIRDSFKSHGYNGLYAKKALEKPDGVAILLKDGIEVLRHEKLYLEGAYELEKGTRDQVALIAEIKFGHTECIIATTHLKSDHGGDYESVRISQAMILLDRLTSMQKDMPIILTGDFNTVPNSELYKLLKTKSVKAGIGDIHKKKYSHLRHKLWIDSAYYQAEQSEPECTIKVGDYESTLDYIWYTPANVAPLQLLKIPPTSDIPVHPNANEPSDHLPLFCEFGFF